MWEQQKTKGFTIVELLIVIVVIAIVAAISIVAYNGIQQRSRNSERSQELGAVQKALALYHIDNGGYPMCGAGVNGTYTPGGALSSGTVASCLIQELVPTYIPSLPADPVNSGVSQYWYAVGYRKTSATTYTAPQTDHYILGGAHEGQAATYSGWGQGFNLNILLGN